MKLEPITQSEVSQKEKHLGQEDLQEEMTTHTSILAWRIPWREEPGGLQSTGSESDTTE